MSFINNKIENALNDLIEKSRAEFEESLNTYMSGIRVMLYAKEREMSAKTLNTEMTFSFTVSSSYNTEKGPLFPPMPAAPLREATATKIPLHEYNLRRSARKPAGYYAE
jgi:hypothetical protein